MKRLLAAAAGAALVLSASAFAQPGSNLAGFSWKLLDSSIPANATHQIRVQLVDGSGHDAVQPVTGLSVRVDMSPDAMADMTAPAKVSPGKAPGAVVVETNLYAPGRWAVILTGTVKGAPVKGSLIVTAKP